MRPFRRSFYLLISAAILCAGTLHAQPQHLFTRYVDAGTTPALGGTSFGMESVVVAPTSIIPSGLGYLTVGTYNDGVLSSASVQLTDDFMFNPIWEKEITLSAPANPNWNVYGTAVCAVNQDYFVAVTASIGGTFYMYVVKLDFAGNEQWTVFLGEGMVNKLQYNPVNNQIVVLAEQSGYGYTASLNRASGAVVWSGLHDTFHSNNVFGDFTPGDMEIDIATGDIVVMGTVTHPTTQDKNVLIGRINAGGNIIWMNQYGSSNVDEEGKGLSIGTSSAGIGTTSYRVVGNRGDENILVLEVSPGNLGALLSAFDYSNLGVTLRAEDLAFNGVNVPQGTNAAGVYAIAGTAFNLGGAPDDAAIVQLFNEGGIPISSMFFYNAGTPGETTDRFMDVKSDGNEWLFTGTFIPTVPGNSPGIFLLRTDIAGEEPGLIPCRDESSVDVNPINIPINDQYEEGPAPNSFVFNRPTGDLDQYSTVDCNNYWFKRALVEETEESLDAERSGFSAFPNPAQGQVTVEFNQPAMGQLRLIDLQGRVQFTETLLGQNTLQLELNHLASGIYLLEWQTGGAAYRKKLVVE